MVAAVSVAGCSGTPFTAASSGSGGSSAKGGASSGGASGASSGGASGASSGGASGASSGGASGTSSGGASGAAGAPDAGAVKCTWSSSTNPCGTGYYCDCSAQDAASKRCTPCQDGFCVKKAAGTTADYNPVCGCNGVTYWNRSTASNHGMALQHEVACTGSARTCKGPGTCDTGRCNLYQGAQCPVVTTFVTGTCWVVPPNCVTVPTGSYCTPVSALSCDSVCTLIDKEVPWYGQQNAGCPLAN